NFFWVGYVMCAALAVHLATTDTKWWAYPVMTVNLVVAAGLLMLFIPGNVRKLDHIWDRTRLEHEGCFLRVLYLQDKNRVADNDPHCQLISQSAINHQSLFNIGLMARQTPINILTPAYDPAVPIVVEGASGWENYHVEKWLLDGADALHIAPDQPMSEYTAIDFEVLPQGSDTVEELLDVVEASGGVWSIRRTELGSTVPNLWETIEAQGYVPTRFTYATPESIEYTVTRYERLDIDDSNPVQFGESIQMIGWTSLDNRLQPCAAVTVRSFWETDATLIDGFSATLTLDRLTGTGQWDYDTIVRADSQLTLTATNLWEPGTPYLDERALQLPCDLPAGDYALRLGVYKYRDLARLPPAIAGEPLQTELATIETITVE
ncbi:MAG: hypothetical protein AAF653_21405, partial [Chloroflexota bacterium]